MKYSEMQIKHPAFYYSDDRIDVITFQAGLKAMAIEHSHSRGNKSRNASCGLT